MSEIALRPRPGGSIGPFADPAVVTVGSFHAGAKHNIISDDAKLQLTVRSYTPQVRARLLDGIKRIARGEAIAAGRPDDRMPVGLGHAEIVTPATATSAHFGSSSGERLPVRPSQ